MLLLTRKPVHHLSSKNVVFCLRCSFSGLGCRNRCSFSVVGCRNHISGASLLPWMNLLVLPRFRFASAVDLRVREYIK